MRTLKRNHAFESPKGFARGEGPVTEAEDVPRALDAAAYALLAR